MNSNNTTKFSKFTIVLFHIVVWLIFIQLIFDISGLYESYKDFITKRDLRIDEAFIFIPLMVGAFYLNSECLFPKWFTQKTWKKYIGAILLIFFVSSSIAFGIYYFIDRSTYYLELELDEFIGLTNLFNIVILGVSFSWSISRLAFQNAQLKSEAVAQQRIAELKFLKAQINPHFLFNTLNTIYALSFDENAPQTSDAILKLSEMMRYITKEAAATKVQLRKEIDFLSNYIELQLIRLSHNAPVKFKIEGEPKDQMIAPLLFIPFVENAFKYGVSYQYPSPITINLRIEEGKIYLNVHNKINKNQPKNPSSNIGLTNVKKRLTYLYPTLHQLDIHQSEDEFQVVLMIVLEK